MENPTPNTSPEAQNPAPQSEVSPDQSAGEAPAQKPEAAPKPETSGNLNKGISLPQVQPTQDPVVPQQPAAKPQNDNSSPQSNSPAIADDVDVIEKEWVEKAKDIVHKTKDDPYTQEKEVSKLQNDYLQKRYGKQLKSDK